MTSPLLEGLSAGRIPLQTDSLRETRERVYNLYSAAIGACLGRGGREQAAQFLAEEARLPYLTPEELEEAGKRLPETVTKLRSEAVRKPEGVTPAEPGPALGDEEIETLFALGLRDRLTGPAREHPRLLLFGGQPGSGKSTLQRLVLPDLPEGTVSYDGDDLLRLTPGYEWAMSKDDRVASGSLSRQYGGLHRRAMRYVREGRVDVVCSHPLGRADWAASWVQDFRDAGYRVEVAFVATHSSNSRFAILDRYHRARADQGFGRWMPPLHHERFYLGVPNTVEFLETHRLADSVYVLSRDGEVLYRNHLGSTSADRRFEPFGRIALEAERGRRELWREEDTSSVPAGGAV